ncbi:MAG: PEP-CTERM sorting domain-containing protein [Nitrosomonas sp.]|uniref:laminin B domain-containing protein n=1 Tax=Nitrosomonas sp. TaxID=42353 RepID=UPI0032EAE9E1
MIRTAISVACCLTILSYSTIAASSLVSSTFDSDTDGWSGLTTDGSSSWSVITSGLAPAHSADGVPAGSITLADPDSQWTYFSAPGKFLGDQSAAFGGSLQFDSRYVVAGTSYANEAEIVLKGAGLTLVYEATNSLPAVWTHFDAALVAGTWRVADTFSGALATDAQLLAVLSNLNALWINAEHFTPVTEVIALDNVSLLSPVPEPEIYTLLLAGFGLLGFVAYRRKTLQAE